MSRKRRQQSLRSRLLIWTLMASLLPSILLMVILLRLNYVRAKSSLQNYVSQVAQQVAESARDYLLISPEDLEEVFISLREDPGFRGACFLDKKNNILFRQQLSPQEALHLSGLASRSFTELTSGRIAYRLTLGKQKNVLGSIVLVYDTQELHSWARQTMWLAFLLLCIGVVLTIIVVNMIGRSLLRPINSIRDTALRVSAQEDYGARAEKYLDDELGDVCEAFNLMLSQIQQRDMDLAEVKEGLERRVLSRTEDLNVSKDKALEIAASLLESNRKIRAILETAGDGILSVDSLGRIESFNRAAEIIFGFAAGDVIGKPVTMLVPLEKQEEYTTELEEQLGQNSEEDFALSRVIGARRSNGDMFPAHLSLSSFHIGGARKYTVLIRDITEEHRTTAEKAELNRKLVETSRFAGMAEVATGVLHNVGNVLNSLNLSADRLRERLERSKLAGLSRILDVLLAHQDDLGAFLETEGRGTEILHYMEKLTSHLQEERSDQIEDVQALSRSVDHIRQVVTQQQNFAKDPGVMEDFQLADILEDAVEMHLGPLERARVVIRREYEELPALHSDKHRILQILVNLVSNAQQALSTCNRPKHLTLRIHAQDGQQIAEVRDDGPGIEVEHQAKIFHHGFTTRRDGHGFGLHSSANAAMELGGQLLMESEGRDRGATFRLILPVALDRQSIPKTASAT